MTLINSPHLRAERVVEKRELVLRWLREELWSTSEILGDVMQLKNRSGVHRTLAAMEHDNLLRRAQLPLFGRQTATLWGITPHGVAAAYDISEAVDSYRYFEPSRVSFTMFRHQIDLQLLRIKAERFGWKKWIPGTRLQSTSPSAAKRPDAIAADSTGVIVAIEVERTLKSHKRYVTILSSYLQAIKRGEFARVDYVSPDALTSTRVERLLKSIKAVPVRGQHVAIDPERHFASFRFMHYDQWPTQITENQKNE